MEAAVALLSNGVAKAEASCCMTWPIVTNGASFGAGALPPFDFSARSTCFAVPSGSSEVGFLRTGRSTYAKASRSTVDDSTGLHG